MSRGPRPEPARAAGALGLAHRRRAAYGAAMNLRSAIIVGGTLLWVLGGSAFTQALAQTPAWPAAEAPAPVRTPEEDAPGAIERAAVSAPAAPAAPESAPVASPAPEAPADVPDAPALFLPDLGGAARLILGLLVLLLAYAGPSLLYPSVLSATTLGPGKAAAACLALGAALAFPALLALMARERYLAGAPVAWFKQTAHYGIAAGGSAVLLALAVLAGRASGKPPA